MFKFAVLALAISSLFGCISMEPMQTSSLSGYSYGESSTVEAQVAARPVAQVPIPSATTITDNDTMMNGMDSYTGSSSTDIQNPQPQPYEMGGVSEDGQSYYPAGVTPPDATVQGPVASVAAPATAAAAAASTLSADLGAATLAQALDAEKQESYGTMIMLLEKAAGEGSAKANYLLAKHYTKGDVVPKDMEQAAAYLDLASQNGYVEATRVQAWNLLLANKTDDGKTLMETAAKTSVRAQRDLGMLYLGLYKPDLHDTASGKAYLQQAYQGGDAEAAFQLGQELGSTAQGDEAMSFAANKGHPKALLIKANQALRSGDKATAKADLEKSAYAGSTDAMFKLGNAINLGQLPSIDKEQEAYLWFSIAQQKGDPRAAEELKALAGVKTLANKKNPGSLDQQIAQTLGQITPWNPNTEE